ncbi:MAG: SDR family NAD(P)-dependent oxidoreductase [Sphingomonadales bacterium]|nr:SDR family NAD(P)-dependent oxidoreductase [Sphingomonadales bacterium]
MDLSRTSALVSGGAGGLGGATSRRLAELGAHVVILEPERRRADLLAAEIGPRAVVHQGDHTSEADVRAAIAVAQDLGTFAINVNSAGISIPTPAVATADGTPHDMGVFREMIELHLMGPFNVTRLAAAAMAANDPDEHGQRGLIVNTSSTAAQDGQAHQVAYAGAKAAIKAMALAMARDLGPIGVRVNAIAPGPIWTPRLAGASDELKTALTANIAFPKRFGEAWEYASLVEMMIRTPFLNGQTIRLDGAMSTPLTAMTPSVRRNGADFAGNADPA